MNIRVTRLTPVFAARVEGADITRPIDDAEWKVIRAAFEEHSVLVFHDAPLDGKAQRRVVRMTERIDLGSRCGGKRRNQVHQHRLRFERELGLESRAHFDGLLDRHFLQSCNRKQGDA